MLIITGDINAKVGNLVNGLGRVMEQHGLGRVNDNGERLKEFCDFNKMVITGTVFPHKEQGNSQANLGVARWKNKKSDRSHSG